MKLIHLSLLLFSALLLNGCISEDMDNCPPEIENNLILGFTHLDAQNKDLFANYIHQVDVFVFDSDQHLVQHKTVDQASLSRFAGTELNLKAGTYHIVSWGNAFNQTTFDGIQTGDSFGDASLNNAVFPTNSIAVNGDSLYYAPSALQAFMVTIPAHGIETTQQNFSSAHIKLEIYIIGFDDKSASAQDLTPLVEITDVATGYNFGRDTAPSLMSYQHTASFQVLDGQKLAVANFYTPLFTADTPSLIHIKKQSDGSTLTTISLKEFIKTNNLNLISNTQIVIPIQVEYKSVGVSVTLPGWKPNPIQPEI